MKKLILVFLLIVVGVMVIVAASTGNSPFQPAPATAAATTPAQPAVTWKPAPPSPAASPDARKLYAKAIDHKLLDLGIESRTVVGGPANTSLVIHDVLAGRVRARAITQNPTLFSQMRAMGFKKLVYTDDENSSFTWNLDKSK